MEDVDDYEQPLSNLQARLKATAPVKRNAAASTRKHFASDAIPHQRLETRDAIAAANPRPLVEQVSNRWVDEKGRSTYGQIDEDRELRFCDLEDDESCPNTTRQLVTSRRFRRMLVIILLLFAVLFYFCKWYLWPRWQEEWQLKEGFLSQQNGTYGVARGGQWKHGNVKIQDLDQRLIPGGKGDAKGKRRLVFVGDIHGCIDELQALLAKVGFNNKHDHLIATGDVISKGPDSPGVLDELIHRDAASVRGNHEDRILTAARIVSEPPVDSSSAATSSKGAAKDAALLKFLKKHHLKYLHDMPLILRVPALPLAAAASRKDKEALAEEILVVHAGLVPAVTLDKQDPYFVMNMRSIHRKTHVPSANRATKDAKNSRPWTEIWNWYNDRLWNGRSMQGLISEDGSASEEEAPRSWLSNAWSNLDTRSQRSRPRPKVVVYGHDSKAGLNIKRWSKGLDTGCVSGGALTAMILDAYGKTELVSVSCKGYK